MMILDFHVVLWTCQIFTLTFNILSCSCLNIIFYVPFKSNSIMHCITGVSIAGKGLQNLGLCSAPMVLEQARDLYRVIHAMTCDFGFQGFI